MDQQLRTTRRRRMRHVSGFGILSVLALSSARAPAVVIVPVMILVLAGLDIAGGIVAKSWALGRSPWMFAAGIGLFALLFWIYGISLRHGELSTITIGWVVLVTLADMGLDRFHYGVHFPTSKWIAAFTAVALLAYLLVGANSPTEHPVKRSSTTATPRPATLDRPATPGQSSAPGESSTPGVSAAPVQSETPNQSETPGLADTAHQPTSEARPAHLP